tara:strand:- start:34 stop:363 length:330 start_codon:yes stop_codon:yes gene_type:complete
MKLNKFLKLSLGIFLALPASIFFGNEMLANHLAEKIDYEIQNDNLLACGGGGGGGSSPAARKAKKEKQAKGKLNFKKRQLSKMAAAGEPTSDLQAEIEALEKELEDLKK